MGIKSLAGTAGIGFVLWVQGVAAHAAEIKVLCSNAIVPIMSELVPRFERATGHKLAIRYEAGPVLKRQIEAGEAFDVAILSLDVDDLIRQAKLAVGTRAVLGRTGVGVAVRKGAQRPDISTTEAFKRTLLNAKSVGYSGGSSGLFFLGLLDRLGIAEEMKLKLKPVKIGGTAEILRAGEAELVVNGVGVILMADGTDLVGPLPPELQSYVVFTGGVSNTAKEAEAGRALLTFLTTPAAVAVFKAKGIEPGTPQ